MDAIRADEILKTIREDHELVAVELGILRKLEHCSVTDDKQHIEQYLELLEDASGFFQTKLLPHFDDEEEGMFQLFRERLPRGSTFIYELQAEHEQMRQLCEQLRTKLAKVRHAKYRKRSVLAHLQSLCSQITALLGQHAQREDHLLEQYGKSPYSLVAGETK